MGVDTDLRIATLFGLTTAILLSSFPGAFFNSVLPRAGRMMQIHHDEGRIDIASPPESPGTH
jgi:hypothetical protein